MPIACDKAFQMVHNFWPRDVYLEVWTTFEKLYLGHNFLTRSDRAFVLLLCSPSYKTFHMVWDCVSPRHGTVIIDLVTLSLKFDLLLKNFKLCHNFSDGCHPAGVVVFWQLLYISYVYSLGRDLQRHSIIFKSPDHKCLENNCHNPGVVVIVIGVSVVLS